MFDAGAFDAPSTAQAVTLLNDWDPAEPILVVLGAEEHDAGKSFRNIARVEALPVEDVGVADVVRAASLLVSEAALPLLAARAAKPERETTAAAPPDAPPEASAADGEGATGRERAAGREGEAGA